MQETKTCNNCTLKEIGVCDSVVCSCGVTCWMTPSFVVDANPHSHDFAWSLLKQDQEYCSWWGRAPWVVHIFPDGLGKRYLDAEEISKGTYIDLGEEACWANFPFSQEDVRFGEEQSTTSSYCGLGCTNSPPFCGGNAEVDDCGNCPELVRVK
jgi:hypothetical protein